MINRNDALSWSILSPTPQCYYHAPTCSHVVYWQGIAMTRVHAMMLIQQEWVQSWATPEMKVGSFKEFKRVYLTGGFGKVKWHTVDLGFENYMGQLRKMMIKNDVEFFNKITQQYTIQEAMMWFADKNRELITDD
jgi:hypothetical protein